MLQMYALRKTIALSARYRFAHRSFSMDLAKLMASIDAVKLDWSLPVFFLGPSVLLFLINLLPPALWAGALTPTPTSRNTSTMIQIQSFRKFPWLSKYGLIQDVESMPGPYPASVNEAKGIFTFMPQNELQGFILNSASGASARSENSTVVHDKLDNTKYQYFNRSYGVGAAVGLEDVFVVDRYTMSYNYYESGYLTDTRCIYNTSAILGLVPSFGQPKGWHLQAFEVEGILPNQYEPNLSLDANLHKHGADFVAATERNNKAIVAIHMASSNNSHMLGITSTGTQYKGLNFTQCSVTFTPTNFSVSVDVVNKTIQATPRETITPFITNSTLEQKVTECIMEVIYDLSQSLSTALYVNPIGNAMLDNIAALQSATGSHSERTNLTAIENVFDSILDNALFAISSAQLHLLHDSQSVPVHVTSSAYSLGTPVYIFIIVTFSLFACMVFLAEAVRTRWWCGISKFDFSDLMSVIVGASEGGKGVSIEAQRRQNRGPETGVYAVSSDREIGGMSLKLIKGSITVLDARRDALTGGL
ncbi:MAG: hypothetical protein Q9160_007673 [Pyrenula sp. 1 TL-2023]